MIFHPQLKFLFHWHGPPVMPYFFLVTRSDAPGNCDATFTVSYKILRVCSHAKETNEEAKDQNIIPFYANPENDMLFLGTVT